jgi:thioredoxin-related protein
MKKVRFFTITLLAVLFMFLFVGNLLAEEIGWIESYEEALEESKSSGKNMFIVITAPSWCYWCQKLEENTFSETNVQDMINEAFVPVLILDEVDGQRNPDLDNFNFNGYPTMLIFSEDEEELHRIGGYVGPDVLISQVEEYALYGDNPNPEPDDDDVDDEAINWVESWDDGFEMAYKENKKVFLLITAPSWCYWCQELEKNTLSKPDVIEKVNSDFIPIKILDTSDDLNKVSFDFGGYPTMAFMEADETLLFKIGGYAESDALLERMEMALDYEGYLENLEKEFEEVKDDEAKAYEYIDKLISNELYEMAEEKSWILYDSDNISDKYKQEFLFAIYITKLMRDQLEEAIDIADEFIETFPESEKMEIVKYYNILCYYYLGDYETTRKLAEEFKEEYPESEFIADIDEILNSIEE